MLIYTQAFTYMTCKRMTDNLGYSDGILADKFLKINNVSISLQEKQWIFFCQG